MHFLLQIKSKFFLILGCFGIMTGLVEPGLTSDSHFLYLSEEVVDFRDYGKNLDSSYETVSEKLDNLVFPENKKRQALLDQRDTLDPTEVDIPERKSFFGKERFLRPGPVGEGITLKSEATWRSAFMIYGTFRSALQGVNSDTFENHELANRLDLFGNLALSGTERFFIGFRPLDHEGDFSGYTFPGGTVSSGTTNVRNFEPNIFFFEGDLGEMLPNLDPNDSRSLDYQFSIGRQPLVFQDGIMINDIVDGFGVTRHNTFLLGASAAKITGFVGLNEIHRGDNQRSSSSELFLLSTWFDYSNFTVEFEAAYVTGNAAYGGDGFYLGLGHLRRFGYWNSTFRANASVALENESATVSDGLLLTHELNRTMRQSEDVVYFNTFLGIDKYTSAARGPATGGPLGRVAFLNRAVGLGTYGAPLGNDAGDVYGGAIGYQHFFDEMATRSLLVEVGGRASHSNSLDPGMLGIGARYQQMLTRQAILIVDAAATLDENGDTAVGGRAEVQVKF